MKKCFAVHTQTNQASMALLVLRIVAGIAFILHGWGKIQAPLNWMGPDAPVPGIFQALAAIAEFGGGICLILGLLTYLSSLGLSITMAVAVIFHAIILKDPFINPAGGSYELASVYLVIFILLMTTGPGRFSLDEKIFGVRK